MSEPRLSTVFDYSELRLHPDGTRVYQKLTNVTPRIAVRTLRNDWIARDAGGIANIRKFKTIKKPSQDLEDEEFIGLRTGTESPKPEDEGKGQRNKHKVKRLDGRKAKRQKFLENYDYLNKDPPAPINLAADAGTDAFPYEPSSDLLKCIHRYASEYYTESGRLLNSSRDYRKQKKKRREERKTKDRTETSPSPMNSTLTPNDESDASTQGRDHNNEGSSESKIEKKDEPQRKGRQRTAKQYRDMYKLFDGSAIMALGMLVQEYIAEALDPQPPGDWDEEILNAFTVNCTSEDDMDGSDNSAEIDSDEHDGAQSEISEEKILHT